MKNTLIVLLIILILGVIAFILWPKNVRSNLISPNFGVVAEISPSPSPSPSIDTFQFNSQTDLKAELDQVNPKVSDQDFN